MGKVIFEEDLKDVEGVLEKGKHTRRGDSSLEIDAMERMREIRGARLRENIEELREIGGFDSDTPDEEILDYQRQIQRTERRMRSFQAFLGKALNVSIVVFGIGAVLSIARSLTSYPEFGSFKYSIRKPFDTRIYCPVKDPENERFRFIPSSRCLTSKINKEGEEEFFNTDCSEIPEDQTNHKGHCYEQLIKLENNAAVGVSGLTTYVFDKDGLRVRGLEIDYLDELKCGAEECNLLPENPDRCQYTFNSDGEITDRFCPSDRRFSGGFFAF